jgi:hypothetical protein
VFTIETDCVCRLAFQPLLFSEPFHLPGLRIEVAHAAGFCAEPQVAVRAESNRVNGEAVEARDLCPADAKGLTLAPHQASFGACPDHSAGLRQDLVDNVADESAGGRVALPFLVASPLDQSPARQAKP